MLSVLQTVEEMNEETKEESKEEAKEQPETRMTYTRDFENKKDSNLVEDINYQPMANFMLVLGAKPGLTVPENTSLIEDVMRSFSDL